MFEVVPDMLRQYLSYSFVGKAVLTPRIMIELGMVQRQVVRLQQERIIRS